MLRFTGRAALDAIGSLAGRRPRLVPLAGEPGTVALLTTPDALDGGKALNPDNRYPDWLQAVAARSALRIGLYRPGRYASRVRCPPRPSWPSCAGTCGQGVMLPSSCGSGSWDRAGRAPRRTRSCPAS